MAHSEDKMKRLVALWRWKEFRAIIQAMGPFFAVSVMLRLLPALGWVPAVFAPICVFFVPGIGHLRFRHRRLQRAIISNSCAFTLIVANGLAILFGCLALRLILPVGRLTLLTATFVLLGVYLAHCFSSRHPVRRMLYWPQDAIQTHSVQHDKNRVTK